MRSKSSASGSPPEANPPYTLDELNLMTIDEKIDLALDELCRLRELKETEVVRGRKEAVWLALELWWIVKKHDPGS
jgi:hypothetical protein